MGQGAGAREVVMGVGMEAGLQAQHRSVNVQLEQVMH